MFPTYIKCSRFRGEHWAPPSRTSCLCLCTSRLLVPWRTAASTNNASDKYAVCTVILKQTMNKQPFTPKSNTEVRLEGNGPVNAIMSHVTVLSCWLYYQILRCTSWISNEWEPSLLGLPPPKRSKVVLKIFFFWAQMTSTNAEGKVKWKIIYKGM